MFTLQCVRYSVYGSVHGTLSTVQCVNPVNKGYSIMYAAKFKKLTFSRYNVYKNWVLASRIDWVVVKNECKECELCNLAALATVHL